MIHTDLSRVSLRRTGLSLATCFSLALFVFGMLPYFAINSARAEDTICGTEGTAIAVGNAEINVPTTNMNGAFGWGYMPITACTANAGGYTLTMQSKTDPARLAYSNAGQQSYIDTLSSEARVIDGLNEFPVNRWGWSFSKTVDSVKGVDGATGYGTYKPVPSSTQDAVTIGSTTSAGRNSTIIYFGAKANSELIYGEYTNTIEITIINNTIPTSTTFDGAFSTYGVTKTSGSYRMQDMTAEICSITMVGESINLVDSRDGKQYTVTKLSDGGCWMTSNLKLSSDSEIALDSTNTDLHSKTSWTLPARSSAWSASSTASVYMSIDDNIYYNWLAATAGYAGSGRTVDSICPYGWTLPYSDTLISSHSSFAGLTNVVASATDLIDPPYNFGAQIGYIGSDGSLLNSGLDSNVAHYWTGNSTSGTAATSFTYDLGAFTYDVASTLNKSSGASLRCVASAEVHSSGSSSGMSGSTEGGTGNSSARATFFANNNNNQDNNNQPDGLNGENGNPLGVEEETDIPEEVLAVIAHIEDLIRRLPSASDVTLEYSEIIEQAISAYEALSDFERSLIDNYLNLKYLAVVAAYESLLGNQPINTALVVGGIAAAAAATGVIVVVAAKKKRREQYYGDE